MVLVSEILSAVAVRRLVLWATVAIGGLWGSHVSANDFVGVLGWLADPEVAREVGLEERQQTELETLIADLESQAIEAAYEWRELPLVEQQQRLTAFRQQAESRGLATLSAEQVERLRRIQMRRRGLIAIDDSEVADRLELTAAQRATIQQLVESHEDAAAEMDQRTIRREQNRLQLQLAAVLTDAQRATWSQWTAAQPPAPEAANQPATAVNNPQQRSSDADADSGSNSDSDSDEAQLRFSFRFTPWQEVIEWFAAQAELSLVMDFPPQGTFNYTDSRAYSSAEAIDLLNSVLLTKGYTLLRRDRMLMVINLEDGIPPNLVDEVTVAELENRGEYELVRCLFTLRNADAEQVEEEISRLVGPQGTVKLLTASNQLMITETAGRLRAFREILDAADENSHTSLGTSTIIQLTSVRASDVLASWRKLMGLSDEENSTPDGSLRVAEGRSSRQLVVSGRPQRIDEFRQLVERLDDSSAGSVLDRPQLEVYSVTAADPTSVLEVVRTLMAEEDDVRLASDPETGNLVALARPAQHQTIRATLDQMQADRQRVDVIRLGIVDPQVAVMAIEKLFGVGEGEESDVTKAPRVDAEPSSRSLLIRGSMSQIEEIRQLLAKLGEAEAGAQIPGSRRAASNLRVLPLDAATAERALDQMRSIWPTVRQNSIRIVQPGSRRRRVRTGEEAGQGEPVEQADEFRQDNDGNPLLPDQTSTAPLTGPIRRQQVAAELTGFDANTSHRAASRGLADAKKAAAGATTSAGGTPATGATTRFAQRIRTEMSNDQDRLSEALQPADIVVTIGDQGLLISSEDTEALDQFEQLFRTLADRAFTASNELAVFYLKFAKAEVASQLVQQFLGGSSSSTSGGGGALLGKLAGAALGGGDGGLLGSLLGMGGGSGGGTTSPSGTRVVADPRLNALIVQGPSDKLDQIEQFLRVVDTRSSPEQIQTVPAPETIPIIYTDANEVAQIIRTVYATRMMSGGGSSSRQPDPEDVIRALSGQKNNDRDLKDAMVEQTKMMVSVDGRRNALIVVAPPSLLVEVRELVSRVDVPRPELQETVRMVRTSVSSQMVQSALQSISSTVTTSRSTKANESVSEQSTEPPADDSPETIKRRFEFLRAIQKAQAAQAAQAAQGNKGQAKAPEK